MTDNKMRMITYTFNIQRCMETLLMYSSDEEAERYLKKLEEMADYFIEEERKLVEKS